MAAERVIYLDPDSEIEQAIRARDAAKPVIVTSDGARFKVVRETNDPFDGYDVGEALDALRSLQGLISKERAEEIRIMIREDRDNERRDDPSDIE